MAKPRREVTREDLISLVRYGNLTPGQAEARAAAEGWAPLASEPPLPAFDPMQVPQWSIVMTVAWIAFRDLEIVRKQQPNLRVECWHWIYRNWREPSDDGLRFKERAGWFLEPWKAATVSRLSLLQIIRGSNEQALGPRMTVENAQAALWRQLAEGTLVAVGLNKHGEPIDIPQRDWSYLQLFEERESDTIKFDALDRVAAYTDVKMRRDDILNLWPRVAPYFIADEKTIWPVEPYMLKPISDAGHAGYVPLCSAIQWIMTQGGKNAIMMDDPKWTEAAQKLWPEICTGEIELIGLPAGETLTKPIPGYALAVIGVLPPLHNGMGDIALTAPSHIACTPYVDADHWSRDFNDKIYETGRATPTWTHLQVRKSHILDRWPRPPSSVNVEQDCYRWLLQQMHAAPVHRSRSKSTIWNDVKGRLPTLAKRQFDRAWARAVAESGADAWARAGRLPAKSNRGIKAN